MIQLIFERKEPFHFSFDRDAQIETILKIGRVKQISIDFLYDICHQPDHSSQIYWREVPIVQINCSREQCVFKILCNTQDILFRLIQPVIQHTSLRYIALLADLILPGWVKPLELIMVLNRVGKLFLIPTETALSQFEFAKIRKYWKIQVEKYLRSKNDLRLLDIIAPESFPNNEFRVSI
ncbi:MAG: hypothetical protein AMS27_00375 [Bacteroides sp. SM23_62_1]|nr:MAG: hypothetical protein AMS27_00375 [Bacteroides sp. SM23_62_1]